MSAVSATILVGSTPRAGTGIMPRWIVMLHEGNSYAWHLLRLQMSVGELGDNSRDDPPGVLWGASEAEDIGGELALLLHLYAARTPEIVNITRRISGLQRRRVDLSTLQGAELRALDHALSVARRRGRELRLSAQIMPGSRLTDQDLLALPDWELDVSYLAWSRDWTHEDGGRLTIHAQEPHGRAPGPFPAVTAGGQAVPGDEDATGETVLAGPGLVVGVGEGVVALTPSAGGEPGADASLAEEAIGAQASAVTRAIVAARLAGLSAQARTITPGEISPPEEGGAVPSPAGHVLTGQAGTALPGMLTGQGDAWLQRETSDEGIRADRSRSLLDRLFHGR